MKNLNFLLAVAIAAAQIAPAQPARGVRLSDAAAPARRALLFGNQNYPGQPLVNPIHDADDLGAQLKKYGFDVQIHRDAARGAIIKAVEVFVSNLKAGDAAVFYYSGHGLQIEGENYLVPVDFKAANMAQARAASVPFSQLKNSLERSQAAVAIMILDSCRNNPFLEGAAGKAGGLAALEAGLGSYIAFAASPGQTASDNPSERNGLFTKYLLRELSGPLHVAELFRKVRQSVYDASGRKQRPYVHDQVIADFYLGDSANAPPAVASQDVQDAKVRYHRSQCSESIEILERAAKRDPENPQTHNALGLAYRCAGLHQEALRSFSLAIDAAPGYAPAHLNRGQLFLDNAKYELALRDIDWAIEQEPGDAAAITKRGRVDLLFHDTHLNSTV